MFDIYTIVAEIHENVNLVLGVNTFVEIEGEISMRELQFKFLNRAVPIFPVHIQMIKPNRGRYVEVEVPLLDEI